MNVLKRLAEWRLVKSAATTTGLSRGGMDKENDSSPIRVFDRLESATIALSQNPSSTQAWLSLTRCLETLEEFDSAASSLEYLVLLLQKDTSTCNAFFQAVREFDSIQDMIAQVQVNKRRALEKDFQADEARAKISRWREAMEKKAGRSLRDLAKEVKQAEQEQKLFRVTQCAIKSFHAQLTLHIAAHASDDHKLRKYYLARGIEKVLEVMRLEEWQLHSADRDLLSMLREFCEACARVVPASDLLLLVDRCTSASVRERCVILTAAARKFHQDSVVAREDRRWRDAISLGEAGLHWARQASHELGSSPSEELADLLDALRADTECSRSYLLLEKGQERLWHAVSEQEFVDWEAVWDAVDLFVSLSHDELTDFESKAIACAEAAKVYQKILKDHEHAKKYAYLSVHLAESCKPKVFTDKAWYKLVVGILRETQAKSRHAEEVAFQEKLQSLAEDPEMRLALDNLQRAREKSWQAFLKHIYTAHPVHGKPAPETFPTEDMKLLLRKALLLYHPDKLSHEERQDERLVVLREEIVRHLTSLYELAKKV